VGVIAWPALRVACRRDNSRRKAAWPPHLAHRTGHSGRPVACQSADQHAVAPIRLRLVRAPPETRGGTAPAARRPYLATARLTRSIRVPRSNGVSRLARLTASGP
jgi:hypothetical protein